MNVPALPWFYVEVLPSVGGAAGLDARESKHARGSRRLGRGDEVTLFDGQGGLARAVIESIGSGSSMVARVERNDQPVQPTGAIHLAAALPKGERAADMLGMATQLGMSSFAPLICSRGVVEPGPSAAERWRRVMIEACKQSRRPFVPAIHHAATPADAAATGAGRGARVLFAHPGGRPLLRALAEGTTASLALLVGPEGGFSDEEIESMSAVGAIQVDLGVGILRVETAAILMVGAAMLATQGAMGNV